jgi:antitoxin (DNA-binding transcriptional repressor) of toxin-antitoxin stability system
MTRITIAEAQLHLPELIARLQPGEAVQIFSEERLVARLVAELSSAQKPRQPGSAVGMLTILSDDQEHLENFGDYMP